MQRLAAGCYGKKLMTTDIPLVRVQNSIRWRLLSALVGLIVVLVLTFTALELALQKKTLDTELSQRIELMKEGMRERGRSMSGVLLTQVENGVAALNFPQVQQLLKTAIEESPFLIYAILVNNDGLAYINTMNPDLEQQVLNSVIDQYALSQETFTYQEYPESNVLEYILPIQFSDTRWGVLRLGFTMRALEQEIARSKSEFSSIIEDLIVSNSSIAALFILLGAVLVWVLATALTRPLTRLTESVRAMGRGRYGYAALLIRGSFGDKNLASYGEIGVLAAAFMEMAEQIRESQQTLENNNRTLEEKVRDRTIELEDAYKSLQDVDQLKTSFLSTVSHELRTPLTSVIGFTRIIQKRFNTVIYPELQHNTDTKVIKAVNQVMENTSIILEEGERLTALINDVLDLAKMEAGRMDWIMQPVSINDIIERAMSATSSLFTQKPVDCVKDIPDHLPLVMGDRDRLIQVMINLISNAVKFTDKGSVTCKAQQLAHTLVVTVVDTGCGIHQEDQALVFEKFKQVGDTLTEKPKGTGLGLPICKEIIEQHAGRLWVESEPSMGSAFSFSLNIISGQTT